MRRRAFLSSLLVAPGAAEAAVGDAAGLSGAGGPAPAAAEAVQWGPPPPGYGPRPWRRRRRRCRLIEERVPVLDRFGRVRGYRTVVREVCR